MSSMGLDIGTSGVKAIVFDADGGQRSAASREYATIMPGEGRAELDSNKVLEACFDVIAEAAAEVQAQDPVNSIGISSQGEAFSAVDADGNLLSNAMVSFDTRATDIAQHWSEQFGRRRLYEITGHTAHPMFSLFKLLWLKEKQPEIWQKAAFFHCFEDLLHLRLGLKPAISYPMAGRTMLFNVRTHDWDDKILSAVELDRGKLARPLPSGTVVGTVPVKLTQKLNLLRGTIIVAGGHDQPCGALGAGVMKPGRAMYGMGTVECICPALQESVFSDKLFESNLCTYDFTAGTMYTTVAFSLTGGNLLRWFRDEWGAEERRLAAIRNIDPYQLILDSLPTKPSALQVLPHFTPTGTPHFNPQPFGAILGLSLESTRGDILRALLEAVSLEMKLNVDILSRSGVAIEEFIAIGGGARNQKLVQLKADVVNRPINTVEVTEAGCLGVAMLAHCAATGETLAATVSRWVRRKTVVQPDASRADFYETKFRKYLLLYPELRRVQEELTQA